MPLPTKIPLRPSDIEVLEHALVKDLQRQSSTATSVLLKKLRYGGPDFIINSDHEVEVLERAIRHSDWIENQHEDYRKQARHGLAGLLSALSTALGRNFHELAA